MKRLLVTLLTSGCLLVPFLRTHAAPEAVRIFDYTGMCLDADSTQPGVNGAKVQLWECHNGKNQNWVLDGSRIRSAGYPGMCLDADSTRPGVNGAKVQLWECHNGKNQNFRRR